MLLHPSQFTRYAYGMRSAALGLVPGRLHHQVHKLVAKGSLPIVLMSWPWHHRDSHLWLLSLRLRCSRELTSVSEAA
jgi:hypothetical protein